MSVLINKARELATEKHAHLHLYNAAKTPAIHHIAEVASLVEEHGGDENMIVAAWLHDIVEDTNVQIDDIEKWFGKDIGEIVLGLTDPKEFSNMPLRDRKCAQTMRLKGHPNSVKLIKICDQLSNVRRVVNDPPIDWENSKKWDYVWGAKQVVDICKGISHELDKKFEDAFEKAKEKYEVKS